VDVADEDAFRAFVASRNTALLRSAYLLTGDHGQAEDLVQTALVKTYLAWSRIREPAAVESYVRRTMATTATSWWRGRRFRERVVETLPDRADADHIDPSLERDSMWSHLRELPARQRAVLVLRYYEGLSEAEIADTLGFSRGAVKSHASRGLATLRRRLADDAAQTGVRA
jgi:RNA polymerase sigma-70 factor, ECF subfamily